METKTFLQELIDKIDNDPHFFDDFIESQKEAEKYSIHQRERLGRFISNLSKSELESFLFNTYIPWEQKTINQLYREGIEGNSTIFNAINEYIAYYGEEIDLDEDFFSSGYRMGDYVLITYCGQGCFHRLSYKGEKILTT